MYQNEVSKFIILYLCEPGFLYANEKNLFVSTKRKRFNKNMKVFPTYSIIKLLDNMGLLKVKRKNYIVEKD